MMSKFKYLGIGTDEAECRRKVASERIFACAIRSLANVKGLQLQCARVLH